MHGGMHIACTYIWHSPHTDADGEMSMAAREATSALTTATAVCVDAPSPSSDQPPHASLSRLALRV